MLQLIFDFLGIEFTLNWTPELVETVLPVLVCLAGVMAFYFFLVFFQFLYRLLKRKE